MPNDPLAASPARNFAIDVLRKHPSPPTVDDIVKAATLAERVASLTGDTLDVEQLVAELRHLFSVTIDEATVLDDSDRREYVPWLAARKADSNSSWDFWRRYMTYLEREFGMAPSAVNALDQLTDMALDRIGDPRREGAWDRRGMVVGSVQSGKTANYTGLICKAVDAGYKLVVVLAGIHSNLRAQTQLRIDEGVLGFDTQKSRALETGGQWIGVGKIPGKQLHIHSLTSSADEGDFSKEVAEKAGVMLGGNPVVLVVKKNSRLLGNLLKWVMHVAGSDAPEGRGINIPGKGRRIVRNVPLLLIDDEADNASIDTTQRSRAGVDPDTVTAINGKIRELLNGFEKASYVGYTATPFANIFVNPRANTDQHGDDVFPRSFIINVKPPSNYVGPARVFGLDADPDAEIPGQEGLDIVRTVDDYDTPDRFPPRHRKEHVPAELPPTLSEAIRCFILVCAARRARGQGAKHSSMLIHVTRFTEVQARVEGLVRDELLPLQRRLQFGDGARRPTLVDELKLLWQREFEPVSAAMGDDAGTPLTWEQVAAELRPAAAKIAVMTINGHAKEALDYKTHEKDGLSVIAIGGDKLSRGLTLEGLSVSYFLRTSRMYDTLMQMGRWFGYRPGYLDLCRLYTTQQLVHWYRHIALADAELRREFDYMARSGRTPMQYALRVREHPDGMIITALNKMWNTQTVRLSWSGLLEQSTQLPIDPQRAQGNLRKTDAFLRKLESPQRRSPDATVVWRGVDGTAVAAFLEGLEMPPESTRATGPAIAKFIRRQVTKSDPELTSWTVALVSNQRPRTVEGRPLDAVVAGHRVGLIFRDPADPVGAGSTEFALKNANLISPRDQAIDLRETPFSVEAVRQASAAERMEQLLGELGDGGWETMEDFAKAVTTRLAERGAIRAKSPSTANGRVVRELRPKAQGLLLLYPVQPPEQGDPPVPRDGGVTPVTPRANVIIGVAVSFPASDTTGDVDYRVGQEWLSALDDEVDGED